MAGIIVIGARYRAGKQLLHHLLGRRPRSTGSIERADKRATRRMIFHFEGESHLWDLAGRNFVDGEGPAAFYSFIQEEERRKRTSTEERRINNFCVILKSTEFPTVCACDVAYNACTKSMKLIFLDITCPNVIEMFAVSTVPVKTPRAIDVFVRVAFVALLIIKIVECTRYRPEVP